MLLQELIDIADKVQFNLELTVPEQKKWDSLSRDEQQEYLQYIVLREYS
jgi:hypothetical protein